MKLNWESQLITDEIKPIWPDFSLTIVEQTDSTNTQLIQQIRQGHVFPAMLVAETQTDGRGRQGRRWVSQQADGIGGSLTFSFAVPMSLHQIGGLSLVIGCAIADALDHTTESLKLKWPNDIWYLADLSKQTEIGSWHKLAGILIETVSYCNQRYAVIGIGINVEQPACFSSCTKQFETLLAPSIPAGSLMQWHAQLHPNNPSPWSAPKALMCIAPRIAQAVYNFSQSGLALWAKAFQRRDLLEGSLLYTSDGQMGTGAGIDSAGNLLIETSEGMKVIHSGEVSVRPC